MNAIKICLVFSGGAALGAAHVGVMKALGNRFTPEYFIGTSAGAIIAAALACGKNADQISDYLKQKSLLKLAFDFSFSGSGLLRGKKVLDLLRNIYEDKSFSDLPSNISLTICATDFSSGEAQFINQGSIADAVRASLSVPGLFEPHYINNKPLVDGGLIANLPLAHAIENYQGKKILAIDVCSSFSKMFPPQGKKHASLRQSIERTFRIFFLQQQINIPKDPRVTIIRPNLEEYTGIDILKLGEIEKIGFDACMEWLNLPVTI